MGGACCVAARDKTIVHGPTEVLHRNHRYSPTWSFRWDNRGRVAGEDTSIHWLSDGINGDSEIKYDSAYPSEDGSPQGSFQRQKWQKSPISEGTAARVCTPVSDRSISRTISMDRSLQQVKESVESPAASNSSPEKLSLTLPSALSLTPSPLLSQSPLPRAETPRWLNHTQHQQLPQVSDRQFLESKSSNSVPAAEDRPALPSWSNNSTWGSIGGSSDCWSMNAFSELMINSYQENLSFDNESSSLNHEKMGFNDQLSAPPLADIQKCGTCSKPLTEKSFFGSRKLIVNNELPVVAVLTCGHFYHAECLETLTLNTNKYDPSCPICTLGPKQTFKLSQKALKAEMDKKARSKKSRKRIVDNDLDADSMMFDRLKASASEGKDSKMSSSPSMKMAKPFLRRHFSFGSKGGSSSTESHTSRKKGFFWTRSAKV